MLFGLVVAVVFAVAVFGLLVYTLTSGFTHPVSWIWKRWTPPPVSERQAIANAKPLTSAFIGKTPRR